MTNMVSEIKTSMLLEPTNESTAHLVYPKTPITESL